MRTGRAIGSAQECMRPHATVSYLPSAAQQVAINAAPVRLQQALAQVEELKRALASSQRQSIAVQGQVDVLAKANAQLKGFAAKREHEAAHIAPRWSTWKPTDFGLSAGPDPLAKTIVERMLTTRIRFRKSDVLYHVDYWDDLGWKEPFAQPQFSERQSWLVHANGHKTPFTPHFFVSGAEVRDWQGDLGDQLKRVTAEPAPASISVHAHRARRKPGEDPRRQRRILGRSRLRMVGRHLAAAARADLSQL